MKRASALLLFILSLALLPMCGGSGDDGAGVQTITGANETGSDAAGTSTGGEIAATSLLRVQLTDKPAEEYQAVYVTVASVRIHKSGDAGEQDGEWIELPVTAAMPVDLLTLRNGVLYELCQSQLAAGHYQQIRLVLTPNAGTAAPYHQSVLAADGVEYPLEVPSGTIKIVHSFTVEATQATDLTLDLDASKSVSRHGNGAWSMKPVIKASSSAATSG